MFGYTLLCLVVRGSNKQHGVDAMSEGHNCVKPCKIKSTFSFKTVFFFMGLGNCCLLAQQ